MNSVVSSSKLCFSYNGKSVLDNLSITFKEGELTCLLGPNGAGKTTLINLMLGRIKPMAGNISWFDGESNITKVKHHIGAMLQNSTAPDKAKVFELIALFASYYPKPLDTKQLINDLNLQEIANKGFKYLSGGQKQLVLFAIALVGDPDLLFLDEPTVGMDVSVRRTLWTMIRNLKARGKTIILTTHYLAEADALADRVIVLDKGNIVADASPKEIKANFQQKCIKATTNQSLSQLQQLPDVVKIDVSGKSVELITTNAEKTIKKWVNSDDSIADLTISEVDLEQAFIYLTQTPTLVPNLNVSKGN